MDLPSGLGGRAFLIAWDADKQKLRGGGEHAHLVTAAVLVDLWRDGVLVDDGKAVAVAPGRPAGDDPVRAAVVRRITDGKTKGWRYWVNKDAQQTHRAVRAQLAEHGVLAVQERKVLGLFPRVKVAVRDPRAGRELVSRCRTAVLSATSTQRVDEQDAALVALVAAVELNTVFSGHERRAHRVRIAELAARGGPVPKALRDVVVAAQMAAASAAS